MSREHTFETGEDTSITITKSFPSTAMARLRQEAPDLTDTLSGRAERRMGEDAEDVPDRFDLTITIDLSELEALHEFCQTLIVNVDGYTDTDGEPIVWKHLDEDEQIAWIDRELSNATKFGAFFAAYLISIGVDDLDAALGAEPDEGGGEGDQSDDQIDDEDVGDTD